MLKRISALSILLLYLVTASGFALNVHYCGRIVTSVTFNQPAKKCTPAVMKCCREQHLEVKIKDAHQGQSLSYCSLKLLAVSLPFTSFHYSFLSTQLKPLSTPAFHAPPEPSGGRAIYARNCAFRI